MCLCVFSFVHVTRIMCCTGGHLNSPLHVCVSSVQPQQFMFSFSSHIVPVTVVISFTAPVMQPVLANKPCV